MELPTWEECEIAVRDGVSNPLQEFIYENEPAGDQDEHQFRHELGRLVAYLMGGPGETRVLDNRTKADRKSQRFER
jgi:hypothetical protein